MRLQHQGKLCLIARPYAAGRPASEAWGGTPLPVDKVLETGMWLADALQRLHELGIVHRNLHPANVILGEGGCELVDFGLESLDAEPNVETLVKQQRLRYAAPEQLGLIPFPVGPYSDVFALGVMLFRMVAGRTPLDFVDTPTSLFDQLTLDATSLRRLGFQVPSALDEIIQHALRKDPRDRYQTVAALRYDLRQLREHFRERGHDDRLFPLGTTDVRPRLTQPSLVGRNSELGSLQIELVRATAGEAGLVAIEAVSGEGKTRLMDELAERRARMRMDVYRGHCRQAEAPAAFELFAGVVEQIVARVKREPAFAARLRAHLGEYLPDVVTAIPPLACLDPLWSRDDESAREEFGENRSVAALGAALGGVGRDQDCGADPAR